MLEHRIRQAAATTPAVVPPAPLPARAAPPTIAAHPFAEVLRQNRLAAARPPSAGAAKDPAVQAPKAHGDEATPAASQHDATPAPSHAEATPARTATTTDASRARARAADDATTAADTPAAASTDAEARIQAKDATTSTSGTPTDPTSLANAQAAAAQLGQTRLDDAPATGPGDDLAQGDSATGPGSAAPLPFGAGSSRVAGAGGADERRVTAADDEAAAQGGLASDKTADAAGAGSSATLLGETKSSRSQSSQQGHDAATAIAQPAGFTAPAATGAANPAAAATVPVPVHSAEFAAAFGMQVSVLAKDGVQRAELHLNPAEMGPVSVQITLDGTQARVDFGADAAATRHAIEAGLPELASALRDAGFTLAGGGVAQHSNPGGGEADAGNARHGTPAAAPATTVASLDAAARRLNRRASAGGVDLYA